jgi:hypothetical protein
VEEGKESQRIHTEFMDFLDQVDPVRGQISQSEVEDTPGRRVPRVGKKNRRKNKRKECGWAAGCLGRSRLGRLGLAGARADCGRMGQTRPSSVRGRKLFFSYLTVLKTALVLGL